MKFLLFSFLLLLLPLAAFSQNAKLADQYYVEGEYGKAADIYKQLCERTNNNEYYFRKYIDCLLATGDYEQSERLIRDQMAKSPDQMHYYVTLGNVLERQNKPDEASAVFEEAVANLPADLGQITKLGSAFLNLTKYDLAIATYERGQILMGKEDLFAHNLADLYRRKGDIPNMIKYYLYSLHSNPQRLQNVQSLFQSSLSDDDMDELQSQLYALIQKYPDSDHFPEMLAWAFMQKKDYQNALRQMRALDTRMQENGNRVYRLAKIAENERDYDAAISAYNYITEKHGINSPFYLEAKRSALAARRKQLTENYDYTAEQLNGLRQEYTSFIDTLGRNKNTALLLIELAELEALYINDLNAAIAILAELIEYPGINKNIQARAKLNLADYYLMTGEIWESTLLYSQVDKDFKEDLLGEEARFRNAKLAYFTGEFEWAQAQFDVLKASTSRFISNDALDLSVFIADNLGLDTTAHPMTLFAEADLLVFQNKFTQAFEKLTLLNNLYEDHGLSDDILYMRGQIYRKQRKYEDAVAQFELIIEKYPEEIRADNALFALAEIYETHLGNPDKARELYEKLFIDHPDSTYSIEARKRFRRLRGDFDNDLG